MEIAIGIQFSGRELRLEVKEGADELRKTLDEAFENDQRLLWLTDDRGRQVVVPLDKLAYIEFDPHAGDRAVGFGARKGS